MKNTFVVVAIAAVVVIGGWYFLGNRLTSDSTRQNEQPESATDTTLPPPPAGEATPPPASTANAPQTFAVSMNADGFAPKELTIRVGDTIVFTNSDTRERWPASGVHPTHLLCPGFDALKPMKSAEVYQHTFDKAATCPMHDHLMPKLFGKITVTP